jgi:hypothetical protein
VTRNRSIAGVAAVCFITGVALSHVIAMAIFASYVIGQFMPLFY